MSYEIHNDFRKYKFFKLPLNALILPPINLLMTRVLYRTPVGKGLIETRHSIAGYQGGSVCLSIISPDQCNADLPARSISVAERLPSKRRLTSSDLPQNTP